jgi:hypothetical protein
VDRLEQVGLNSAGLPAAAAERVFLNLLMFNALLCYLNQYPLSESQQLPLYKKNNEPQIHKR